MCLDFVSDCLFLCQFLPVYLCMPTCLCVSVSMPVCLLCLSELSVFLSVSDLSTPVSVFVIACLCLSRSVSLSVSGSVCLSVCVWVGLSVCLCQFACLFSSVVTIFRVWLLHKRPEKHYAFRAPSSSLAVATTATTVVTTKLPSMPKQSNKK